MEPLFFDAHCHPNFVAYDADRDEVIQRALGHNVWMCVVGTQKDTSLSAIALAEKYEHGVYAIVGLHPIHTSASFHDEKELGAGGATFTSRGEIFEAETYRKMLARPKVVAIGECGLDYYRLDADSIVQQKKMFRQQIALANEVGRPLMLHIRNGAREDARGAYKDALDILREEAKVRGNVHFFAGTIEDAKGFLDLGFTLSFTGAVTFPSRANRIGAGTDGGNANYRELIEFIPLDRILSETDAPYITPVPYRGTRNEPLHVREVVSMIAEIKKIDVEVVKKALVSNARRLFNI